MLNERSKREAMSATPALRWLAPFISAALLTMVWTNSFAKDDRRLCIGPVAALRVSRAGWCGPVGGGGYREYPDNGVHSSTYAARVSRGYQSPGTNLKRVRSM